ncbi:tape measure protein [Paenibacillus sp. FSL R5-0908]|uniref:tape measure protein n=1 Tax=Paenibacillus sp. FSL R5-0908 TaxID=2921664 RepID=UPI0030F73B89
MAREFVMGVKLALNDQFFPGISPALQATERFRSTVEAAEESLQRLSSASRTALQGLQSTSIQVDASMDAATVARIQSQVDAIRPVLTLDAVLDSSAVTRIGEQFAALTSNVNVDATIDPGAVGRINTQLEAIRPSLNLDITATQSSINDTESRLRDQLNGLDVPLQVAQATIQQIRSELRASLASVDVNLTIDSGAIAVARTQLQGLSPVSITTDLDGGVIAALRTQLNALSPLGIDLNLDGGVVASLRTQLAGLSPVNIDLGVDGDAIARLRSQLGGLQVDINLDVDAVQIARLHSQIQSRLGSIEIRLDAPTILPNLQGQISANIGAIDLRLDIPPHEIARIRAALLSHDFVINPRIDDDAIRRLQQELDRVRVRGESATRSMGGLRSQIMGIGALMGGGFAVKGLWDGLVGANADMETYQNTLAVILKDQDKAAQTLKWASTFAATTPFEIPEVVEATTKMAAYGIEAQKVLGVTGDMASVMGKSLDQAVEAIADAQTGELERLKEFGITKSMIEAQGAKMGSKLLNSKGQITDQTAFNAALFSLMEQRYGGGMEMQAKTFKGMMSNAKDFVGTMAREMGKPLFDKMKVGLGELLTWTQKIQDNGQLAEWMARVQRYAGVAWRAISAAGGFIVAAFRVVSAGVRTAYGWIKWIFDSIAEQAGGKAMTTAQTIGSALVTSFNDFRDAAQPVLQWLIDTGLPLVQDALVAVGVAAIDAAAWMVDNWGPVQEVIEDIGEVAYDAASFIIDNWSLIGPIVEGLAISFGSYYLYLKAIVLWTKLSAAATAIWTAAQVAWTAVMSVNPIYLILVGIGLLIAGIILLVKNWDTVSAWLLNIWGIIRDAAISFFGAIGDFFVTWGGIIWNAITTAVGAVVNWMADSWNGTKDTAVAVFTFVGDFIKGIWDGLVTGLDTAWNGIKSGFTTGVQFIVDILNGMIDKINSALDIKLPDWLGGKEFAISIPHIPDVAPETDGSHATGITRVPFDGYTATLHRDERVLTAAESRRYDPTAGIQQPMLDTRQLAKMITAAIPSQEVQQQTQAITYNVQAQIPVQRFAGALEPESSGDNAARYETALQGTQGPPPTAKPAAQVTIEKLVDTVQIMAAPGDDGEALYEKFMEVFYRKAQDAKEVLSVAGLEGLL